MKLCGLHRRHAQGFSLIELMIVVAIIGLLAVLAAPTYRDFTIRARASEIITFAASYKTDIAEYYAVKGVMPTWPEIQSPTRYIHRIEFWRPRDDRLVIHVYPSAAFWSGIAVDEDAILLEAVDDGTGNLKWACGPHSDFRAVPNRLLPSTCRDWIDNQA
jgi:type IV pilus assembly protein PilA